MTIEWHHDTMTTGSRETDDEHREWIRRFNEFESAVANKQGLEQINHSLQFFADYSHTHFPHEEALMDQYKCPAADLNRAEHEKFREKLQQLQAWIQMDGASLVEVIQLKIDMELWLVNHIGKVDTQLRQAIAAAGAAQTPFAQHLGPSVPGSFVEAILQSSPDAILIVDQDGKIVYAGGRCQDLLGYDPYELLGQSVERLVPAAHTRHSKLRESYSADPRARAMGKRPVLSALHKSGARVPIDIALSPLPPVAGMQGLVQAVIRDALPRWNAQRDLLVQSVAMNAAANGIVLTDMQGVIQWVNPAVTRMTGYTSAELIGKTPSLFKSGQHDAAFYTDLWQTVMDGRTWFGEIINRHKDGSIYYEEQHIAPVRNEDGQITHLIAIKQDVTARRLAEQKLQQANQQLQQQLDEIERLAALLGDANKALEVKVDQRTAELARANHQLQELDNLKSAFLGVISHELRSPFAGIGMSMKLFESYGLDRLAPEQRELYEQFNNDFRAANAMIENLVNYASFVSRQGELRLASVDMAAVAAGALLPFKFKAGRKNIALTADLPAGLPRVRGDQERLNDAVSQLVDNAIKFTPAGGRVTLRVWQADGMLHLAVEDSGPGIPAEKLATLWESFAQMADPLRRGREGLGLGLALVEYIVRAHHGQIWAESQPGLGSTFGFRLPME